MNDMWEALERYQPYADKHGFGAEWRRMTTERTEEAAWRANDAVWFADGFWAAAAIEATVVAGATLAAVKAVRAVADAAARAAWAARAAAARAAWEAEAAIRYINRAIELEEKL